MKFKRGDTVKILYGKDAGRKGRILLVRSKTNKVVVEGINEYKRHLKGDGKTRESEIVNIVKPVDASKLMLICPSCSKAVRVGFKIVDGKKNRVCKKCGKTVDTVKVTEDIVKKAEKLKTEIVEVSKTAKEIEEGELDKKTAVKKGLFARKSQQSYRNAGNK